MNPPPAVAQALAALTEDIREAARAIEASVSWQEWAVNTGRWRTLVLKRSALFAPYVSPPDQVDCGTQQALELDA